VGSGIVVASFVTASGAVDIVRREKGAKSVCARIGVGTSLIVALVARGRMENGSISLVMCVCGCEQRGCLQCRSFAMR